MNPTTRPKYTVLLSELPDSGGWTSEVVHTRQISGYGPGPRPNLTVRSEDPEELLMDLARASVAGIVGLDRYDFDLEFRFGPQRRVVARSTIVTGRPPHGGVVCTHENVAVSPEFRERLQATRRRTSAEPSRVS